MSQKSNVAAVTVIVEVKRLDGKILRHCAIEVDVTHPQHAQVSVEQMGDGEGADNFTRAWLKSALDAFEQRGPANRVDPEVKH